MVISANAVIRTMCSLQVCKKRRNCRTEKNRRIEVQLLIFLDLPARTLVSYSLNWLWALFLSMVSGRWENSFFFFFNNFYLCNKHTAITHEKKAEPPWQERWPNQI